MPASRHLADVGMTYLEHLRLSSWIAWRLFAGGVRALVHAIFPDVYVTSTTRLVLDLSAALRAR